MDISIIIISFNTKELTLNCIDSIVKNTKGVEYEVIVVDNASEDGSVEALKKLEEKIGNLKIIENKKNVGFGPANNQGMKEAEGEFILLLNSDTIISYNLLSEMTEWMRDNEKVGVATCALRNKDGSLQGTGGYFPTLTKVFAWMFFIDDLPLIDRLIKPFHPMHAQSFYKGTSQFKEKSERDWITGAFALMRREVVEQVGYFDEDYFMYTEEVDLCYRVKNAGWEVWYLPKWSITHLGGASSTKEFPILSEYDGIKLFYKKHMPKWQYPVVRFFLKLGALARIFLFGTIKGKGAAKTYVEAFRKA